MLGWLVKSKQTVDKKANLLVKTWFFSGRAAAILAAGQAQPRLAGGWLVKVKLLA
jgi:hypothetical protein